MMDTAEIPTIGDSTSPHRLSVRYTPENPLLVDRYFARLPIPRGWAIALVGAFFLLIPAILAYESAYADIALLNANYRAQFIYALLLVYVLLTIPVLERASERVVRALRPVTKLNDDAFQAVVDRASSVASTKELLAFGVGMAARSSPKVSGSLFGLTRSRCRTDRTSNMAPPHHAGCDRQFDAEQRSDNGHEFSDKTDTSLGWTSYLLWRHGPSANDHRSQ